MAPPRSLAPALALAAVAACGIVPAAAAAEATLGFEVRSAAGVVVADWDPRAVRTVHERGRPFVVRGFPLPGLPPVDLELAPFAVTSRRTRFVVGRKGGADRVLDFDPATLSLFRGRVAGRPTSSVLLALGTTLSTGHVDLGSRRFGIASRDEAGRRLPAGSVAIFEPGTTAALPPPVPLCGVSPQAAPAGAATPTAGATALPAAGVPRTRHLELAVDTDHEFFELFGDLDSAATYLVALYAQVSDIYLRDVDTWIELVYARLWDDPDDLFNDVDPSPLGDFRSHWNSHMGAIQRDLAQLLSGRRDYPFGGQAFLASLCGSTAYSVVGYASGSFPDPALPSPYHYDIEVTAHEIGHNAGTGHTHDAPNFIDSCADPGSTPRRGSLMSYCGQTWSGGQANQDLYFHTKIRLNIESHVFGVACAARDCNLNGADDLEEIQQGQSADADGNLTPDECEDCNGNDVLDGEDVARGTSPDLNGNGIPDECEADCDRNGVPDDRQIALGQSLDLHGNGIPDECETDCDADGVSDYSEIQASMPLDVDRSAGLDACQDCDGDGTPDLAELGPAHRAWVASGLTPSVLRAFHPLSGVRVATTPAGPGASVRAGQDLIAVPGGRVLVSNAGDGSVKEFDALGGFGGNLVAPGAGGLRGPAGLLWTPEGRLLVASRDGDAVLEFDGASGAFLRVLVAGGASPLDAPFGMTLGPEGALYVTSEPGAVLRYDRADGTFLGAFVPATANGGLLQPRGLAFKGDGNLLVASYGTDRVLEYDGASGAPLGPWSKAGTASVLTQDSPWGVRIGPNGNVFVSRTGETFNSGGPQAAQHHDDAHGGGGLHLTNAQIYEYDVRNGNYVRAYVSGHDHGLDFATGFDFVPGWGADCNFNVLPDGCDVASGASADADSDGVPDECQSDCDGNGVLDRLDVIPFGPARDCNANLVPDACDVASGASGDCGADGVPDECEADCNRNGAADSCDLLAGTSTDCNANGVPDECDALVDFESDPGWTVGAAGDTATAGLWVRVNPVGTAAQTEYDHTPGGGRACYVTGQGGIGEADDAADVDGGSTTLVSAPIDVGAGSDPHLGYWRWFSNDAGPNPGEDALSVEISGDDGRSWSVVETVGPGGTEASGGWFFHLLRVADFVAPAGEVRLRFVAADGAGDSLVEAAIDDLVVLPGCCPSAAACDDGLSCTVDDCIAGHCESAIGPGTCLIDGTCRAAGEVNPADDCEACDPSAPGSWSPAPPAEVASLVVSAPTLLSWTPQSAAAYDVVGGSLSELHLDGGVAGATCLEEDHAAAAWEDPRPDPEPGAGNYYLVRAVKSCGAGSYGSSSSGVPREPVAGCL